MPRPALSASFEELPPESLDGSGSATLEEDDGVVVGEAAAVDVADEEVGAAVDSLVGAAVVSVVRVRSREVSLLVSAVVELVGVVDEELLSSAHGSSLVDPTAAPPAET